MKAHAGGVGTCWDPLWGWRSWQTSILPFPSNELMLLGTIFHSPSHWLAPLRTPTPVAPPKPLGEQYAPVCYPLTLLSQRASALSPYHSHSSTAASWVHSLHGGCLWNTWPWWPHPQTVGERTSCKLPPPSTAQIDSTPARLPVKKKKAYLFLLEGRALGFHTSGACGGLSENVGQGMPFLCSLLVLLQLIGTHPPQPLRKEQSLL